MVETLRKHETCATLAFTILTWLVKACRALTINELQIAVSLKPNKYELKKDDIPDPATLVDICAGFIVIDEKSNAFRLAHFTVHEYIIRKKVVTEEADLNIAIAYTTYLSFGVFKEGPWRRCLRCRHTPLHWAAEQGYEPVVRLLIEKGASIFAVRYNQRTALHCAAYIGHEPVVRLLIENNADISATDKYQSTPVHLAAEYGYESVWTALHLAATNGHEPMVRLLIEKGADISAAGGINKVLTGCQSRDKEDKDFEPVARVHVAPQPEPELEPEPEPQATDEELDPKNWKLDKDGNMVYIPDLEEKGGSVVRI
ncbi:ankyrin repeat-containing domain protein [Trichophaea hybrida]|nr:ankyrin repeat-containing domain protein [Trichophaea hybrida]